MDKAKLLKAKFIQACTNLDVRIIEHYLKKEDVIMGLDKYRFLAYLHELFNEADRQEIVKLIPISKYCRKCHLEMELLEFWSQEHSPEYFRYLPKGKVFQPVFAFAFPKQKDRFEVERCEQSWGFQSRQRFKDREEVRKLIYGNFG